MSAIAIGAAVATWGALLVRYYLKVPKGRVRLVLLLAGLTPWVAFTVAVVKGFSVPMSAWIIAVAAAIPWLATGFKPELMIDAKYIYGEEATEEQQDAIDKYQFRAIGLIVLIVVVGVVVRQVT
ncbi:hypothetical protein ACIA8G_21420 [Lentzea sp. NPDC051213]|uniref:hypothetical protein n=1 Tax=Lentzea sp. NPDC051213 TaxID=3364126 RepID=UPI00379209F1